jgi:hypothetical protein
VQKADAVEARIEALCAEAEPLADLYPPVGVYVHAACATEAMIAKLALDPRTVAWLQAMIDELRQYGD